MSSSAQPARMRLRVRVHALPGGTQLHRVITADSLRDTHLTHLLAHHCGFLGGNRADLLRLGALFRLAAVSPHSAVYLPLRSNEPTEYLRCLAGRYGMADLVVARRDIPLRPSDWPAIRTRLHHGPQPGVSRTMLSPAPRPLAADQPWDWLRHRLAVAEYASTVFFRATSRGLHAAGDALTICGEGVATNKDIHRYGGPALLMALKGEAWRTGRPEDDWECDILAEDRWWGPKPARPRRRRQDPRPAGPVPDRLHHPVRTPRTG